MTATVRRSPRPLPRSIRFLRSAVLAAVAAALSIAAPASGQSSSRFASPLSSADLARWVQLLELEGTARRTAEAAFERTLAESQAFRDGDISAFERDARVVTDPSTTVEILEQRSRRSKALLAQQAAIENRLFDELAALVPESRQPIVEAQRRAAARRRSAAAIDFMSRGGLTTDLVDLARREESFRPTAEANAVLLAYDIRLTDLLQRASSLALESGLATRKALDAAGATGPVSDEDPALMRQRMAAMAAARQSAQAPINEIRNEIIALHRTTLESLVPLLSPETARAVRRAFLQANYRPITIKRDSPERLLASVKSRADSDPSITPDMVATATRLTEAWHSGAEAVERKMMDTIDERRRTRGGAPFMAPPEPDENGDVSVAFGDFDDGLGELRAKRDELATSTRNQIAALAPALADLAREDAPGPQVAFAPGTALDLGGGNAAFSAVVVLDSGGGAEAMTIDLPGGAFTGSRAGLRPIESTEFDAMMDRLGWTPERRDAAQRAFDAYATTAAAHVKEALGDSTVEAPIELSGGGGGAFFMATSQPADGAALDAALAALAVDDAAFFDALGGTDDPALVRERGIRERERLRQRAALGSAMMLRPWGRFEKVDLPMIVAQSGIGAEDRARVQATADASGDRMSANLGALIEANERMRKLESSLEEVIDHGGGRIERSVRIDSGANDEWPRAAAALDQAQRAIVDDVRRSLDQIAESLSPQEARRIRRAAYTQALPQLMHDPRSAESRLEQAVLLESLSDETRRSLIDLLARHQAAVDALVDAYVTDAEKLSRDEGPRAGPGPGDMRSMRQSDQLQRRLRFDRSEVNDATMRRLRAQLGADENARIEDLPPSNAGRMETISFPF